MSADPSVEENFSAIDVRCLSCGLTIPPPSPLLRISHHPHPPITRASKCKGVRSRSRGFLEYVCLAFGGRRRSRSGLPATQRSKLRAAWLRQAKPDLSRAFQYTAPAPVLTISFLHPVFQNVSWKLLESWSMFPRALLTRRLKNFAAFLWSFSEREQQDSLTLAMCFYQVLRGSFLWLLTLGSPHDLWPLADDFDRTMTYDLP